jgi:hypothetical protein
MSRNLINTPFMICSVLIFSLLYIYIVSSPNHQAKNPIRSQVSFEGKDHAHLRAFSDDFRHDYVFEEIVEEDDEEHLFKLKVTPRILYNLNAGKIDENFYKTTTFYKSFSCSSNQRYLSLQVFRL